MASSFVKFAEDSKQDPNPPRFIEWWRYSHPAAQRRIDFALSYRVRAEKVWWPALSWLPQLANATDKTPMWRRDLP